MLALLPVLALISLFICLRQRWPSMDWRSDVLRAALLFGVAAIWLTQILSWFSAANRLGLALGWTVVVAAPIAISGVWRGLGWDRFRTRWPADWLALDWGGAVTIGAIAVATAIVARWSPPQTWDTLNYHLARVAHWAQMASVRPYATGIEIQNSMPPGAEMLVLQPYVLAAGDAWVNCVDWTATWIVVLGVALLAGQLGAGRKGQFVAAIFLAAMPMAIVQASSTMTDVILTVWLVGIASEVLQVSHQADSGRGPFLFMAAGAGLAIVTKPTAFAYLLPFAVWAAVLLIRQRPVGRQVGLAAIGVVLVLSVNWGYFSGNVRLYGNPVAPANRISEHASPWLGGRGFVSNLLRNATYQLATPSPYVNKAIALSVITVHNWMGLDPSDQRTTAAGRYKVSSPTTKEDLAQNPLQMLLVLAAAVALVAWRRNLPTGLGAYSLAVGSTFLAFSLLYKWQVFGSRYLLPFFALAAPIIGALAVRRLGRKGTAALMAVLAFGCLPWLLGVDTRPLAAKADSGDLRSVVTLDRTQLMFANGPYLEKPYTEMADQITAAGCSSVGLMLSGAQAEYPLWSLLGAPRAGLDIEWIVAGTPSAVLEKAGFAPCALIREADDDFPEVLDALPLVYRYGAFGLYLGQVNQAR